jgi:hypothetical protein
MVFRNEGASNLIFIRINDDYFIFLKLTSSESNLETISDQLSRLPTHRQLAQAALGMIRREPTSPCSALILAIASGPLAGISARASLPFNGAH